MAKDRSFAAKVAKAQHVDTKKCPVCGAEITTVHVVKMPQRPDKQSWRFKERFIGLCKCTEKELTNS
jgi:hypothetical protein